MSESGKKWYVLRAISGKENKVREVIEGEMNNTSLGQFVSQVLIPTEKVVQLRNGKKVIKERNYLPGYVLVEAELTADVEYHLKNLTNVIGFLSDARGNAPTPLRPSEVKRLLGTVDTLEEPVEELGNFVIGEAVKVNDGPFAGFSGVIEEVNNEKKKLKIMVKIFDRKTPLELGFLQVEKE